MYPDAPAFQPRRRTRRLSALLALAVATGAGAAPPASLISLDGAIGPPAAEYVARATRVAAEQGSSCLILQLDTPGGLLDSTKEIVQAFYASPVPVVVHVVPSGANAGSAGCFITLAADVAAMAPNTSIGAAHPVELGGLGGASGGEIMARKLENFAVSTIEAIAEKRGRNVEWARAAVRDSASITAERALELGVIDLVAPDLPALLQALDGRVVRGRALATAGAEVRSIPRLARERVFQLLWRPELMFILMLVAVYGLIGELANPGAIFPGIVGAIALILALYLGSALPVNIAGLALLGLAFTLFIADLFAPTHGLLTAGAILSFLLGSLLLFDGAGEAFRLPLAMVLPATVLTAAFFLFGVGAGLRSQALPVRTGPESLLGQPATALSDLGPAGGRVTLEGESWFAVSETPVAAGSVVIVSGIDGLTLRVHPPPASSPCKT